MKKSILNIDLMNIPTSKDSNRKNNMYRCGLDNWTVGFIVVYTWLLMESFSYKPCFVALNGTISMLLNAEDPFAANCILIWQRRNKIPCAIFEEGIKFKVHRVAQMGAFGSQGEASGFLEIRFSGGGGK